MLGMQRIRLWFKNILHTTWSRNVDLTWCWGHCYRSVHIHKSLVLIVLNGAIVGVFYCCISFLAQWKPELCYDLLFCFTLNAVFFAYQWTPDCAGFQQVFTGMLGPWSGHSFPTQEFSNIRLHLSAFWGVNYYVWLADPLKQPSSLLHIIVLHEIFGSSLDYHK